MVVKSEFVLPKSLSLYGSGSFAQTLIGLLQAAGVVINHVFDHKNLGAVICELPVEPMRSSLVADEIVFVAINNFLADIPRIHAELSSNGAKEIWLAPKITYALRSVGIDLSNYWMTGDSSIYRNLESKLSPIREKLSDERSRETLDGTFRFRTTGEIADYFIPEPLEDQYFPKDIPFINADRPINYLDLGAFDGDGVRQMAKRKLSPSTYIALEPEINNFRLLCLTAKSAAFPVTCLPLAASNFERIIYFSSSADGSSASVDGQQPVQTVAIDSILHSQSVSHVKFDIEGSELDALHGLSETIRKHHPALAISVYHKPEDVWHIFEHVDGLGIYRDFYIRTYGHQTFDTILYCIP